MPNLEKKSSEQTAAEAEVEAFRQGLGPFVTAAETTRMAMVFTNAKAAGDPIIFANDSFLSLTGFSREDVLGRSFNFLMANVTGPEALAHIEADLASGRESVSEQHCRRKDGSEFWAAVFISAVRDEYGAVVQHFGSFVDLTRHIEDQVRSKMLIEELNHRVKNTLSTVQSIVWQALRTTTDQDTIRDTIESRLFALSRSHDLLTQEDWKGANLLDLINAAMAPFGLIDASPPRLSVTGVNIRVPPRAALALGIAFHELGTNASKYGAFSIGGGVVDIEWTIEPGAKGDRLVLSWRESGGPLVAAPTRKGFGSQVLERGLAHELGGEVRLDYRSEGLVCTMNVPLPRGAQNG
jgi:PAS domain S-box-containing protein